MHGSEMCEKSADTKCVVLQLLVKIEFSLILISYEYEQLHRNRGRHVSPQHVKMVKSALFIVKSALFIYQIY